MAAVMLDDEDPDGKASREDGQSETQPIGYAEAGIHHRANREEATKR